MSVEIRSECRVNAEIQLKQPSNTIPSENIGHISFSLISNPSVFSAGLADEHHVLSVFATLQLKDDEMRK